MSDDDEILRQIDDLQGSVNRLDTDRIAAAIVLVGEHLILAIGEYQVAGPDDKSEHFDLADSLREAAEKLGIKL